MAASPVVERTDPESKDSKIRRVFWKPLRSHSPRRDKIAENEAEAGSTSEGEATLTTEEKNIEMNEPRARKVILRSRRSCPFREQISAIPTDLQKAAFLVKRKDPNSKKSQAIRRSGKGSPEFEGYAHRGTQ